MQLQCPDALAVPLSLIRFELQQSIACNLAVTYRSSNFLFHVQLIWSFYFTSLSRYELILCTIWPFLSKFYNRQNYSYFFCDIYHLADGFSNCSQIAEVLPDGFRCPNDTQVHTNGHVLDHARYIKPDDCRSFYLCMEGKYPSISGCPEGTVFNDLTLNCDAPENVPGW